MYMKSELEMILPQIVQIYQSVYGDQIVRIMLYGSYARGDYHTDSDIDIVAIVQGERSELQERLKRIWDASSELELEYDTILSPTVIPYAEYEKCKDCLPYYKNIESEGVDIVA